MTHIEIVKEAINSLNRNKKAGIKILAIRDDGHGGVDVKLIYPKPIKDWDGQDRYYGFTKEWFKPEKLDLENYTWMEGFKVSDALRVINPEAVAVLRIAYYFWKHGKDEQVL